MAWSTSKEFKDIFGLGLKVYMMSLYKDDETKSTMSGGEDNHRGSIGVGKNESLRKLLVLNQLQRHNIKIVHINAFFLVYLIFFICD